jgi:hypothetical protein
VVALVIDNRAAVQGPGVHALIIGVSDYLNLPDAGEPSSEATWSLNKLTSPTLSAFKVFDFIRTTGLRLPLKTVRLLLSPSQVELNAEPALAAAGATRANRAALDKFAADWRNDAAARPDDMTLFYFAGHGTQRGPEEAVLMLEDFLTGASPLGRCFEIGNVRGGMAPSPTFPNIALTQFYFVDACMDRNAKLKTFVNPTVPEVFGVELNVVDRRAAPLMYSTVDGAIALGRSGKPSHFAEALVLALQRAAEEPDDATGQWPVTTLTMKSSLDFYYTKHQLGTLVKMGSIVGSPVIRFLAGPPDVDISIEVQPDSLGTPLGIGLLDENNVAVPGNPAAKMKFELTVKAGFYRVQVDSLRLASSPYRSQLKFVTRATLKPWTHNLVPLLKPQN